MNNKKLTAAQELSLIKARAAKKVKADNLLNNQSGISPDIKNSYINNLHMKSSMFMLWIISTILAYAHKIPFIGKIISLLSLWYGRTTIWKVLVKIRKLFLIFNAAIGVLMVYKTVGYDHETFMAGILTMGDTYLKIFVNMTKRLFNWFFELFDYRIAPNIPNKPTPPTVTSYMWHPRGLEHSTPWYNKIPDLSKIPNDWPLNPFGINVNINSTPWYRDLNTWLWVGGSICVAGFMFLTFKFITDPLYVSDLLGTHPDIKGKTPITKITPPESNEIAGESSGSIISGTK
jgi:hypothetical protein